MHIGLGADEFLAMLEGKIRVTPFFKVQPGKIAVCWVNTLKVRCFSD